MNNDLKKDNNDLSGYKIGKFTLLQFMAMLAIIGVVATMLAHYFF